MTYATMRERSCFTAHERQCNMSRSDNLVSNTVVDEYFRRSVVHGQRNGDCSMSSVSPSLRSGMLKTHFTFESALGSSSSFPSEQLLAIEEHEHYV